MSPRELVVLGTASQAPTRRRNHNGYFLRWDDEGLLFDPGEGTQRQMLFAGVTASEISRICVTHFHGDHCLGLPGVLARMSLDRVRRAVEVYYPAQSQQVFWRLRHASLFRDALDLREQPVRGDGQVAVTSFFAWRPGRSRTACRRWATGWPSRTDGGCSRTGSPRSASPARISAACNARATCQQKAAR